MDVEINPENDKLYNVLAAIPNAEEVYQGWVTMSEQARANNTCHLGIKYGDSARETLDIFPNENPNAPVMMFIHGGYWQARDPSGTHFVAPEMVKLGFCVVSVGYDLCPNVTLDKIISQIQQAARHIWHHIGDYGGDRNRFFVCGHSAGGHLTAEMMATDWSTVDPEIPNDFVKGGAPVSGLFDLEPLATTTINIKVGLDEAAVQRNSPLYRDPVSTGPIILAVGGDEGAGFEYQSDSLRDKWGPHLASVKRITIPGAHHMAAIEELGKPGSELLTEIGKLIR